MSVIAIQPESIRVKLGDGSQHRVEVCFSWHLTRGHVLVGGLEHEFNVSIHWQFHHPN